ncbi:MAG: hypothetical protein ACI8WY_004262, partial [Planctomycetota bacterium]
MRPGSRRHPSRAWIGLDRGLPPGNRTEDGVVVGLRTGVKGAARPRAAPELANDDHTMVLAARKNGQRG